MLTSSNDDTHLVNRLLEDEHSQELKWIDDSDTVTDICEQNEADSTSQTTKKYRKQFIDISVNDQHEIIDLNSDSDQENTRRYARAQHDRCSYLTQMRTKISNMAHSESFDRIIFLIILINSLTMAIEHHGQPQILSDFLEYTNYIFTILFTIELILKIGRAHV